MDLGFVPFLQFLLEEDDAAVQQATDDGVNDFFLQDVADIPEREFVLQREGFDDHVLLVIEFLGVFGEERPERDEGLAGQFEVAGQSGVDDFADRAGVVLGHPLPELYLLRGDQWFQIDDGQDRLGPVPGVLAVQPADDARVMLAAAELYFHAQAFPQLRQHLLGDRVGVGLLNGEGEQDVREDGSGVGERGGQGGAGRDGLELLQDRGFSNKI